MSKTILVTGAAGFIGSHVAEALLGRGDVVVGLDNLDDYYEPARKRANLALLRRQAPAPQALVFVQGDVRDGDVLAKLFDEFRFDAVVHLAAMAGVRASVDRPRLYHEVNAAGALAVLDAARRHGAPHLVLGSSSSVYGTAAPVPFVETDPCNQPLAPYAASKRAAELTAQSYHHAYGMTITALRFFTVYGPRGRPDMMPYKVVEHLLRGAEVPLYDEGRMLRDWTYVGDIVAGVLAAADRPLGYQIINLGRGEPVRVADFIAEVERQTGRRGAFRPEPLPPTDVARTHASIDKARRLLGYRPGTDIREGIAQLLDWYRRAVMGEEG